MSYNYAYTKRWRYEQQRGHGPRYIDPAPTVAHLNNLLAQGHAKRAVAEAAGVSAQVITHITRGDRVHITRKIATRILAVRVEHVTTRAAKDGFVPRIGVTRRLQALQALGHTAGTIATAGGLASATVVHNLISQRGHWASRANRDAVLRAYNSLWDQPGNDPRVASAARTKGWHVPLAWDDDTIDDPHARPHVDHQPRPGGKRVYVDDVEWVLEDEPLATAQRLADRLSVKKDAIQVALSRAERHDLLDQLNRNAELANPGRTTNTTNTRKAAA